MQRDRDQCVRDQLQALRDEARAYAAAHGGSEHKPALAPGEAYANQSVESAVDVDESVHCFAVPWQKIDPAHEFFYTSPGRPPADTDHARLQQRIDRKELEPYHHAFGDDVLPLYWLYDQLVQMHMCVKTVGKHLHKLARWRLDSPLADDWINAVALRNGAVRSYQDAKYLSAKYGVVHDLRDFATRHKEGDEFEAGAYNDSQELDQPTDGDGDGDGDGDDDGNDDGDGDGTANVRANTGAAVVASQSNAVDDGIDELLATVLGRPAGSCAPSRVNAQPARL